MGCKPFSIPCPIPIVSAIVPVQILGYREDSADGQSQNLVGVCGNPTTCVESQWGYWVKDRCPGKIEPPLPPELKPSVSTPKFFANMISCGFKKAEVTTGAASAAPARPRTES